MRVSMIQSIEVSSDIAEVSVGSIADVIYVFSPINLVFMVQHRYFADLTCCKMWLWRL